MTTALDIIKASLRKLAVLNVSEEPTADQLQDGLSALSSMLDMWSAQDFLVPNVSRETLTLTNGLNPHTYGAGGNLNSVRPEDIIAATLTDGDTDYPLMIQTLERYNAETVKSTTGRPYFIYFVPEFPLAKVYFDLVPDKAYTVTFDTLKPFTAPTNGADVVSLRPAYEKAIIFNLALDLAPEYGMDAPAYVVAEANAALKVARRRGGHIPQMSARIHGSNDFDINRGY